MAETSSPNLTLVEQILSGLAKVRSENDAWVDSESEGERESRAFKIGECLRPFYLTSEFPNLDKAINPDTLVEDTRNFFRLVERDGFFPSPYSPISPSEDQYTDFAAFVLDLSGLVHNYWPIKSKSARLLAPQCRSLAKKALSFLLNSAHHLVDENGCRWGGTSAYRRKKKGRQDEIFTDTYFTSVVVLGLQRAVAHPVLGLAPARQAEVRKTIAQGGKWIASRFDGQLITGDEGKTDRALLNTTWGLRALVDSYDTQDQVVRKQLPSITNAYIDKIRSLLDVDGELPSQQEYLTILSEDVQSPLYYEDRSGIGGILLTLASLRLVPDLDELLADLSYPLLIEQVLNSIMALRNQSTKLWYGQGLILSIHSYLAEAFLLLHQREKDFGHSIDVSRFMIRSAVREVLTDDVVISTVQQAVYQRLLRQVEKSTKQHLVKEKIDEMALDPAKKTLAKMHGAPPKSSPGNDTPVDENAPNSGEEDDV